MENNKWKNGKSKADAKKAWKRTGLVLTAVLLLGIFAGCGGDNGDSEADQNGDNSKVLTMAVGAELTTLFPLNMDQQNYVVTKLCYEGLVNYVDGEVVPCLAESWEFSEDGTALTFHLKEGVQFHDGTALNAEAVKTLFDYAKPNENFRAIKAVSNMEAVEAVNEYTVTFRYPAPYYAYLTDFCYPEVMILVSPEVLEEGNYQTMKAVVGTGAYIYDEIEHGEYVRFVRNDNYWGDPGYYDEIIVKYIPESSSRLQALQNGEIDMVYGNALISWDDYEQAVMIPDIEGQISQYDSETRNLVLNAANPALGELNVRKAIAYGIDKDTISEGLTYGYESVAYNLYTNGIPYTDAALNEVYSYDKDKAESLLEEAGWTLNESTGVREKDGTTLSLTFTYDSAEALNKSMATAIQSQLAEIGIQVETLGQDMYTWWMEGVSGNYDITIWNTEQPYTSPHNFFTPMLDSSPHTPAIAAMPDSGLFAQLIEEFQQTDDRERVAEIFEYLLQYSNDNVLNLPITYAKEPILYNKTKIADYTFTSTPMFFDLTMLEPVVQN